MRKNMLPISIAINIFFLILFLFLVNKLGGWNHLIYKINNQGLAGTYQHRAEHLKELPITSSDIVFLGNSLTQYCEWSELLQQPNLKNRGIAGDGVEGVLKRLPKIISAKPKAIFLMIGVNDLFFHDIEFILSHYKSILQQCNSVSPDTKVFVQSVLPVNNDIKQISLNNDDIIELNRGIQQLTKEYPYPYLDLHSKFVEANGKLNPEFSVDGIHINGKGYEWWGAEISQYISELNF